MGEKTKVTGPASYFPSIEKKYGQPIEHWLKLLSGLKDMKHMETVNWLKTKHGMGHGHANALVGYLRAKSKYKSPPPNQVLERTAAGRAFTFQMIKVVSIAATLALWGGRSAGFR